MQDPSTYKLQTPNINQWPNSKWNPPPTHHLPTTLCLILKRIRLRKPHTLTLPPHQQYYLSLTCIDFKTFFIYTSIRRPTVALRSSSGSPHKTKSSVYKRPGNLYSFPSSWNPIPLPPFPFSTPSLRPYILKSQGDMIKVGRKLKKFWIKKSYPS